MIDVYSSFPSSFIDAYQQRLRDRASIARVRRQPRDLAIRQRLGDLLITVGARLQGHRPAAVPGLADSRVAPN